MPSSSKVHLSPARLKSALARLRRLRILVVGDLMLDEFIYGRVPRISPEAPVPVVLVEDVFWLRRPSQDDAETSAFEQRSPANYRP